MSEHEEEPAQKRNKIDLTVAGHTVIVDSDEDLISVEATVRRLFAWSAGYARGSTVGFTIPAPDVERSPEEL